MQWVRTSERLLIMELYLFINSSKLSNKPNQTNPYLEEHFFSFKLKKTKLIQHFLSPSNNSPSDWVLRRHRPYDRVVICNHLLHICYIYFKLVPHLLQGLESNDSL